MYQVINVYETIIDDKHTNVLYDGGVPVDHDITDYIDLQSVLREISYR
ncbi:hypothetical protein P4631_09200 [Halalkalibacterium halodurans]|nr:hypothetical protein [Halalkalibacterium halodurans]